MMQIYSFFISKKTKIIFLVSFAVIFVAALIALLCLWNSELSLKNELIYSLSYFTCFLKITNSYHNPEITDIDYQNTHIHLMFAATFVLGLLLIVTLLNLFFNKVDKDYFIRCLLLLGQSLLTIIISSTFFSQIHLPILTLLIGIVFLIVGLFYLFLFVLDKIYDKTNYLTYLINFGAFYTVFYALSIIGIESNVGSIILTYFYYPIYLWIGFLIGVTMSYSGPTFYVFSALMVTDTILLLEFFIINIIYIKKAIFQAIKKRPQNNTGSLD